MPASTTDFDTLKKNALEGVFHLSELAGQLKPTDRAYKMLRVIFDLEEAVDELTEEDF